VKTGSYDLNSKEWRATSPEVRDLITKLMEFDYNKRLSANEALDHPWIQKKVKSHFNAEMATAALSNLNNFTASEKLKQAAITFMTTHLATKQERMYLMQSFQQFDVNGDGKIELDEFVTAY